MQRFVGVLVLLLLGAQGSRVSGADPQQVRVAVEKSVALLQSCDAEFFRRTGCIACHQQSVTALAVGYARERGIGVDENTAKEQHKITSVVLNGLRDRSLQRVDDPFRQPITLGYYFLGLAAQGYAPDISTDALVEASDTSTCGESDAVATRSGFKTIVAVVLALMVCGTLVSTARKRHKERFKQPVGV